MISSSIKFLTFTHLCLSCLTYAMQKPQPLIPASPSMVFPIARKESSEKTQKGSLIKRMGRSISALLDKQPKEQPSILTTPSRASADSSSRDAVKSELQMVFGKPVYTIEHEGKPCFVSIDGSSFARYRVHTLAEFKADNAFLLRPEVLIFINKQLEQFNKEIPYVKYYDMSPHQKQAAAQIAYKYIKKFKDEPGFKTPFYVVRLMKNDQVVVCVFEQEIKS